MFAPSIADAKLRAMTCNHAVTAPLWETLNAGSCQEQASMQDLTFLLDEEGSLSKATSQ